MKKKRKAEQIEPARFSDRSNTMMAGGEIESCFCGPVLDGTAGSGCEPDEESRQQLILPPQWQQAGTGCLSQIGSAGAANNCDHASKRPDKMADNRFINSSALKAAV
jgi:hypothetical protein